MIPGPVYRTLREQIADRIRFDVLSGELERGASLPEEMLAKKYGVSRAPVRDALLQLTQEGILEAKPNCGVKVGLNADEELQPLVVNLRKSIEEFALRKVFDKLTVSDINRLAETVEGLGEACKKEDLGGVVFHDMALHRHIVEAAESPDLLAMWLPIVSRMFLHYSRHRDIMESYREHVKIVEAIREGDVEVAVAALSANIQ